MLRSLLRASYLLAWLAVPAVLAPAPAPAATPADAAQFIDHLVAQGIATITDEHLSRDERERRFNAMLRADFDLPRISRYVLGRYWREASAADRDRFDELFGEWVVRTYGGRLSHYSGETVKVTGARAEGEAGAVVASEIVHPSGPPTKVEWRVSSQGGQLKIIDIEVEGLSMALTERDEIAAVIQRSGGSVAGLNRALEAKLDNATALGSPAPQR